MVQGRCGLTSDMMHEGQEQQHICLVRGGPHTPIHIAAHVKQQVVHIPLAPPGIPPGALQYGNLHAATQIGGQGRKAQH